MTPVITDDMIWAMQEADVKAGGDGKEATHLELAESIYPLIRKQVLEEAARVCDDLDEWEVSCGFDISAACAQAIRKMVEEN